MRLCVIIPTLNEAAQLPRCIESIRAETAEPILVTDGGSTDGTEAAARKSGASFLSGAPGLAAQCNLASARAAGELLLFCAADTRLGAGWRSALEEAFYSPAIVAAGFRLRLDDPGYFFRLVEWGGNFRSRVDRMALPDQGLCVRRAAFLQAGKMDETSLVPFAALCHRLQQQGDFRWLGVPSLSSVRKWKAKGAWRTTLNHVRVYSRFKRLEKLV